MSFTTDELLSWASRHEADDWATLKARVPFRYHVTSSSIQYIPSSGSLRNVPRRELDSFCREFQEVGSFAPGKYPHRWHKSYSLALVYRFLQERQSA